MDESQTWQARYDELRAALRRIGAMLGDRSGPAAQHEAAAQEFVATWQAITRHIRQQRQQRQQPTIAAVVPPST